MPFFSYTFTTPTASGTVVAGSTKYAREKVWGRAAGGGRLVPGFERHEIRISRGVPVKLPWHPDGGHLVIPEIVYVAKAG